MSQPVTHVPDKIMCKPDLKYCISVVDNQLFGLGTKGSNYYDCVVDSDCQAKYTTTSTKYPLANGGKCNDTTSHLDKADCVNWISISATDTVTFSPRNVVECGPQTAKIGRKVLGGISDNWTKPHPTILSNDQCYLTYGNANPDIKAHVTFGCGGLTCSTAAHLANLKGHWDNTGINEP